jgi:RimJ/RimL family protein N-acetyltransferase
VRAVNGKPALAWLEQRASWSFTPRAKAIAAIDSAGHVRGVVAYDNFTLSSCETHVWLDTPLALRALLPGCFRYPFIQLGLKVVTAPVAGDNTRSLALARRMGFRETHRVRDGWAEGVDLVLHEVRPADCKRYLEGRAA